VALVRRVGQVGERRSAAEAASSEAQPGENS